MLENGKWTFDQDELENLIQKVGYELSVERVSEEVTVIGGGCDC